MPSHEKHHHKKKHHEKEKVSHLSVFNTVTVSNPVKQQTTNNDATQTDGIGSCFKSLFQCMKP